MRKLLAFLFIILATAGVKAQCDQAFIDACSNKDSDAHYVKHFRIRFTECSPDPKKRSEGKFTIMLNKGNHYRFYTCNDPSKNGQTIIEISNDFASYGGNYNASTDTQYSSMDFICTKTGPYYLNMFFKDGKEGCGVCVVALVME